MYPNLFNIEGFSMTLMIILGVIFACLLMFIYLRKNSKANLLDLSIVIFVTVFVGVIFGILFENLYEAVKASISGKTPKWTFAMTFYGGLFGGAATFLLMYKFYYLKHNENIIKELLRITPSGITLGHAFGRLGCFLSGCCYGVETDSWVGIEFPNLANKVVPTQLIEMIFLLVLCLILSILAFKRWSNYEMPIYLISYGIFRFVIEFFRGDERGQLVGLSPSQYWSIALLIGGIILLIYLKKKVFVEGGK